MSTGTAPNNTQDSLRSSAGALFVGLLWSGAMLFVFGFWMRSKYGNEAKIVANIFLVSGVAALGLALWQAFTLWFAKETPEKKVATLSQQRRIFSYVFLAGGLALIVMAFVLGVVKKPTGSYGFALDNFAETFGCLLFGLIGLACGYGLQLPQDEDTSPIAFLVGKVPVLKLTMLVIGAISLGAFCYLGFYLQIGLPWFPELAALVLMSMLCMACLLWLNTPNLGEPAIRVFVLVFGGSTGLILFILSIGRAIFWRQDIFLGGISSWQGANAWHFWLCAYAFFASLVLMFVSFNLARADVRSNVVLRRVMYGYDTIVQGLLLLGILAVLNVVVYALVPFSYDWTKTRGTYALADSTKNIISGLKNDVNVVVLLPQTTWGYRDVHNLLDNCRALNPHFNVEYVSPDANPYRYEELAKVFPKILPDSRMSGAGRGVLIVNGPIPKEEEHKVPYSFVPERKLSEIDRAAQQTGEKGKNLFKGEIEIIKELKFLLQDRKNAKVYILQGDDEPDISDMGGRDRGIDLRIGFKSVGIGFFVERLKNDNYEVVGLTFRPELVEQKTPGLEYARVDPTTKKKEIPKDCKTLIVAGVSNPLASETIEAIERYMESGGKMLVFLDVIANSDFSKLTDTGLEPMLKRFGVEVTDQFGLSIIRDVREDPRLLFAATPFVSDNPLPKQFADKYFFLKFSARILKPAERSGRYRATSILQLDPYSEQARARFPSVSVNRVNVLKNSQEFMAILQQNPQQLVQLLNKTPACVGAAVVDTQGDKPCLVVLGDTELITNREIKQSPSSAVNYAFVVSAIEWMAEREGIGALPKETPNFSLPPGINLGRMVFLPGWLMFLAIIGLGVGIWVARRR